MSKPITYKGHSWICVQSSELVPTRFWNVQLLTDDEYNGLKAHGEHHIKHYRSIVETDMGIIRGVGL